MAKACLSGKDYLLWKSEWYDLSEQQVRRNAAHNIPISIELLTGEGQYLDLMQQLVYPVQVYQQINICAMKAWHSLPTSGAKSEELSSVRQGPDELYQNFVSRLLQAVSRTVSDAEAGE